MASKKNKKAESRYTRWTFTINNWTEEDLDLVTALNTVYLIYGKEHAPSTGTPHIQGFAIFKHGVRMSTLQRKIKRAHWEPALGSDQENLSYISKEDPQPYIRGSPPLKRSGACVNAMEILEKDPLNGARLVANKRTLAGLNMEREMLKEIRRNKLIKPKIVYIYGTSGSGKTYYALRKAIVEYGIDQVSTLRFDKSGFAHCSNPQAECLVISEFRPSCIDAVTFLELTDGYGLHLNVKHGSVFIRPKCLFICSIIPPTQIYKEEINQQFMRRITEIINKDNDPWIDITNESEEDSTIELASETFSD